MMRILSRIKNSTFQIIQLDRLPELLGKSFGGNGNLLGLGLYEADLHLGLINGGNLHHFHKAFFPQCVLVEREVVADAGCYIVSKHRVDRFRVVGLEEDGQCSIIVCEILDEIFYEAIAVQREGCSFS